MNLIEERSVGAEGARSSYAVSPIFTNSIGLKTNDKIISKEFAGNFEVFLCITEIHLSVKSCSLCKKYLYSCKLGFGIVLIVSSIALLV
jgi:hypothetical protein